MSEIRAGDLVMIVKLRPCGCGSLGYTFTAGRIDKFFDAECTCCGAIEPDVAALTCGGPDDWVDVRRLIKIDPPALPESVESRETLTA